MCVCVCCEWQRASLRARKPWPLIFFSPSLEEGRQQTQTHDKGMNYIYLRCEGRRRDRHFPTAPFTEPQEKSKGAQQGRPTLSFQRRSSSFPSSSWRSSSSSGLSLTGPVPVRLPVHVPRPHRSVFSYPRYPVPGRADASRSVQCICTSVAVDTVETAVVFMHSSRARF